MKPLSSRFDRSFAWLAVALIIGFTLRVYNLGYQSLWTDELYTWWSGWQPDFASFWKQYTKFELTPPLYYFWHFAVGRLVEPNEISLRSSSVFFGLSFIFAMYLFGKQLGGRWAAVICAFFAATSYRAIYVSQEARTYSLLFFLAALSSYAWYRLKPEAEKYKDSGAVVYVLSAVALAYTHYFGVVLVMCQGLTALLVARWNKKEVSFWLVTYVVISFAYFPWLYFLATHELYPMPWMKHTPLSDLTVAHRELFGSSAVNSTLALLLGLFAIYAAKTSRERRKRLAVFSWVFLAFLTPWLIGFVKPFYSTRYYMVVVGPALAIAGLGAYELKRWGKAVPIVFTFVFCILGLHETIYARKMFSGPTTEQIREATARASEILKVNPDAGLMIIGMEPDLSRYYLSRFGSPKMPDAGLSTSIVEPNSWPSSLQSKNDLVLIAVSYGDLQTLFSPLADAYTIVEQQNFLRSSVVHAKKKSQ